MSDGDKAMRSGRNEAEDRGATDKGEPKQPISASSRRVRARSDALTARFMALPTPLARPPERVAAERSGWRVALLGGAFLGRRLTAVLAVLALIITVNSLLEPEASPLRFIELIYVKLDKASATHYLNATSRVLGVLLAATITLCGISIPLTANNYTPKLIELFIRDRMNWGMLGLMVMSNLLVHWTILVVAGSPGDAASLPHYHILLSAIGSLAVVSLIIPYAFYVFRALEPERIVSRIEGEVFEDLRLAAGGAEVLDLLILRQSVLMNVKYISNITLRSLERGDRDTSLSSLEAVSRVLKVYLELKGQLPRCWFRVSPENFLAKPLPVLKQIEETGTVVEVEVMEECALLLSAALGRFRDVVRNLGVTLRRIGVMASEHDEAAVLEMVRLYFNSFIRAAISKRNPDAIYTIVFQYRQLAEYLMESHPIDAVKIARYLEYYAHQAVRSGIVFVANLIAYDLGSLVLLGYQSEASCRRELFEVFMHFDHDHELKGYPGVVKAHLKLLLHVVYRGDDAEANELRGALAMVKERDLRRAFEEISEVDEPYYWEITDRRHHVDYVEVFLRPTFARLRRELLGGEGNPVEPMAQEGK